MPEMPEVEALRCLLERRIVGACVRSASFAVPKVLKRTTPEAFSEAVRGLLLTGVGRRGKYLLLQLHPEAASKPTGCDIVVHLKMKGILCVEPTTEPPRPYLCATLDMEDGRSLRFYDMWRWGEWTPLAPGKAGTEMSGLAAMGPEPFDERFTPDYLAKTLARKRGPVKNMLLDQKVLSGLGNLYCDECLHRARLHPCRPASALSAEEVHRLHTAIREVLDSSLTQGRALAATLAAQEGNLEDLDQVYRAQVYDRPGHPCPACGQTLLKFMLNGRGTTHCPNCQPDADNTTR